MRFIKKNLKWIFITLVAVIVGVKFKDQLSAQLSKLPLIGSWFTDKPKTNDDDSGTDNGGQA